MKSARSIMKDIPSSAWVGICIGVLLSLSYGAMCFGFWPSYIWAPKGLLLLVSLFMFLGGATEFFKGNRSPSVFGLILGMVPIWLGTILYVVGFWFGFWGFSQ